MIEDCAGAWAAPDGVSLSAYLFGASFPSNPAIFGLELALATRAQINVEVIRFPWL
jgi:hypothetical protein